MVRVALGNRDAPVFWRAVSIYHQSYVDDHRDDFSLSTDLVNKKIKLVRTTTHRVRMVT